MRLRRPPVAPRSRRETSPADRLDVRRAVRLQAATGDAGPLDALAAEYGVTSADLELAVQARQERHAEDLARRPPRPAASRLDLDGHLAKLAEREPW